MGGVAGSRGGARGWGHSGGGRELQILERFHMLNRVLSEARVAQNFLSHFAGPVTFHSDWCAHLSCKYGQGTSRQF